MSVLKLHARHIGALRAAHLAGKRLRPVEIEALLNTGEYWMAQGIDKERARIVALFKFLAAPRSGMGSGLVTRQRRDAWLDAAAIVESAETIAPAPEGGERK